MKISVEFVEPSKLKFPLWIEIIAVCIFTMLMLFFAGVVRAETLTASWYSLESCLREGTSGIMANGKELNDENFTCASWDYPFNTYLLVTNLANGRSVVVQVTDRGPAKRLYQKGRVIDLSKGAFAEISSLKQGIIPIKVELIR